MKDQSLRVLIIEDSEDDEMLLIRELKKGGYNPVYERVETAAAMKKALKEKQWDIILCDYRLPQFNAPSAIAALKEANIDIPLIIVTGTVGEETAAECMRLGAKDYIMKDNKSRLCPAIARELEDVKIRNMKKQAEKDLQEREDRFRRISSLTSDIAYSCRTNEDGIFSIGWMIGATEQISGYSIEEIKAQSCWRFLVLEEDRALFEKNVVGLEPGSRGFCELRIRHKNGSIVWIASNAECFMATETPEQFVLYGALVDITKRKKAEEALREGEERYRLIFENSPLGLLSFNEKGVIVTCNDNFVKIIGSSREKLVGLNMLNLPDKKMVSAIRKVLNGSHGFYEGDYSSVTAKKITPVRCLFAPMNVGNGRIPGGVGIIEDITERKKAEEALQKSEARYRLISENTADLISVLDMNLHFTYVSPASMRLRGLTVEEAMEQTLEQVLTPESLRLGLSVFEEEMELEARGTADPDRIRILELEEYKKDGSIIWVEVSLTFLRDKNGKPIEILTVSRDITERKQADEALRKSEEKYRTILADIQEGYFEVDLAGNFTFFNDSLCQFFDSSKEELMGMNYRQYTTDKEHSKELFQVFNRVYSTGEPIEGFDWQIIRRDGIKRYVEASVSLRKESSGKPIGFRGIARDVTEHRQVEDALRESENRLRAQYNGNPIPTYTWQKQGDEFILKDFNDSAKIFTIGQRNSFLGKQASEMYKNRQEILVNLHRCFNEKIIIKVESVSEHFMPGKFVVITFVFVTPDLVMVHMEDITERKQAEEALKNSEAKYRNIFENAIEGVYQSTIKGRFITANAALARMAGYDSPEELIESIKDIGTQFYVHPEDRKRFLKIRDEKGFVSGFEVEFYRKDGSTF
jgi:PAS domain S-box-containing protein